MTTSHLNQTLLYSRHPERPRLTVAAVVEQDGKFLFVEERHPKSGALVINQPAGHVEGPESLLLAVVRETFEETGWHISTRFIVGIYQWGLPDENVHYVRIAIAASLDAYDPRAHLDEGIERIIWLSPDELAKEAHRHRSPLVTRCVEDYLKGEHYPLSLINVL